jgi:hypothetical protein
MIGRNHSSLRFRRGLFQLIPGWFLVLEDSLQGPPLDLVLPASRTLDHLSRQHAATNFDPLIHVLEHLCSSPSITVVFVLSDQISISDWRVRSSTPLLTILRRSPAQALAFSTAVHVVADCSFVSFMQATLPRPARDEIKEVDIRGQPQHPSKAFVG